MALAFRHTCMPPEGDCHAWVVGLRPDVDSSKRTFPCAQAMSALPPKADMWGAARDVRFGPKQTFRYSFDQLVGALLELEGYVEVERLRRPKIDNQLEFRWQLY